MLELVVVEAEEVVHDNVASQCWKSIGQVHRLPARFVLLEADAERVDVPVDYVNEVEDGTA